MNDLKFKAKWFPLGPILAFAMCVIVIFGQNYQAFLTSEIDWYREAVSYIGLLIFLALWLGYKLVHKTKVVPLKECSFEEMSSK